MGNYDFSRICVLVCDDSPYIRMLLRSFLKGFGVGRIIETIDAREGFMEFIHEDPDIIISDWNMGETSGIDLVNLVRWSEKSPNSFVPIIMLSGYTEIERIRQARDAGISGYLAKPLTADGLYRQLRAAADDRRSFIRDDDFFGPDRRSRLRDEYEGTERRQVA